MVFGTQPYLGQWPPRVWRAWRYVCARVTLMQDRTEGRTGLWNRPECILLIAGRLSPVLPPADHILNVSPHFRQPWLHSSGPVHFLLSFAWDCHRGNTKESLRRVSGGGPVWVLLLGVKCVLELQEIKKEVVNERSWHMLFKFVVLMGSVCLHMP